MLSDTDLQEHEFAWTGADFTHVQKLIYQKAGISLHDGKKAMVYSRLSRRLRETGHKSFSAYLGWLESSGGAEWQEFINALTTNLTSFFRENHHFDVLRDYLHTESFDRGVCKIWCSAASTGEEPYSLAMTATEMLGRDHFKLTASDIDSKVLATAKNGIYNFDALKTVPDGMAKKYFLRGKGSNSGLVRAKPELRDSIDFMIVNLIEDNWPFREAFDVVFCRNVMIYFDAETQRKVLAKIHRVMKPGGLLFVGHAENFSDSRDLFHLRGKTVYSRVGG
ncbi:methyltransferase domain-containing protein [Curvibacter sp. CHRR-16]|uniref:CheR family methyltransferase n=1 Tax=Curvibacter sp. CHRR-16 TaxID=2835872 RepID=UPI001BD9CD3C|nr:CheR family methyltransferase [Curvibacter sp. CHRR-16]MBT0569505.1 methyltransferase domain-containing protein [Curvibacter sp. CHRR-16]